MLVNRCRGQKYTGAQYSASSIIKTATTGVTPRGITDYSVYLPNNSNRPETAGSGQSLALIC
jgi:hypothetical protein